MGAHLLDQIEISAYLNPGATPAQVASVHRLLTRGPADRFGRVRIEEAGSGRVAATHEGGDRHRAPHREPSAGQVSYQGARSRKRAGRRRRAFGACSGVQNAVYGQTVVRRLLQLGDVLRTRRHRRHRRLPRGCRASSSRIRSGLRSSHGGARSRSCNWSARRTSTFGFRSSAKACWTVWSARSSRWRSSRSRARPFGRSCSKRSRG